MLDILSGLWLNSLRWRSSRLRPAAIIRKPGRSRRAVHEEMPRVHRWPPSFSWSSGWNAERTHRVGLPGLSGSLASASTAVYLPRTMFRFCPSWYGFCATPRIRVSGSIAFQVFRMLDTHRRRLLRRLGWSGALSFDAEASWYLDGSIVSVRHAGDIPLQLHVGRVPA